MWLRNSSASNSHDAVFRVTIAASGDDPQQFLSALQLRPRPEGLLVVGFSEAPRGSTNGAGGAAVFTQKKSPGTPGYWPTALAQRAATPASRAGAGGSAPNPTSNVLISLIKIVGLSRKILHITWVNFLLISITNYPKKLNDRPATGRGGASVLQPSTYSPSVTGRTVYR